MSNTWIPILSSRIRESHDVIDLSRTSDFVQNSERQDWRCIYKATVFARRSVDKGIAPCIAYIENPLEMDDQQ